MGQLFYPWCQKYNIEQLEVIDCWVPTWSMPCRSLCKYLKTLLSLIFFHLTMLISEIHTPEKDHNRYVLYQCKKIIVNYQLQSACYLQLNKFNSLYFITWLNKQHKLTGPILVDLWPYFSVSYQEISLSNCFNTGASFHWSNNFYHCTTGRKKSLQTYNNLRTSHGRMSQVITHLCNKTPGTPILHWKI